MSRQRPGTYVLPTSPGLAGSSLASGPGPFCSARDVRYKTRLLQAHAVDGRRLQVVVEVCGVVLR